MNKDNPIGTDGFEFIEYCSPMPNKLATDFTNLGFVHLAQHKTKSLQLFRQGDINFILNMQENTHAAAFAKQHGPAACAMGFRVKDAEQALKNAIAAGAKAYHCTSNPLVFDYPAIQGIGDSVIYFVDHHDENPYVRHFELIESADWYQPIGEGLKSIDHLTHNLRRGEMDKWYNFYKNIFNFREIRFFDIKGKKSGLISRALTSPCNKIKIPLNESQDEKSQIEEFIQQFNGEGIQHIALTSDDIYTSVRNLTKNNIKFLDVPDTYYEAIEGRIPEHGEPLALLRELQILIDGTTERGHDPKLLLQLFTENMLGPVFFEIIQRKGDEGFGEGNFQALFDAIECDQMRRGAL